ncbi:YlbF family regulator [Nigerium sp.]|uniref:YlbF family regulator n=1 Tax=Nigerium sp. TaxID=2042655 RepID=UPI0032214681
MLTPELHDAAQAFGRALRQTPAVAAYRAATDALADDVDAQRILMALRGPQASYVRTQQAGLPPSQEQIDQLRRSQERVRANEVLMNHLRATNAVKAYLPTVASDVSGALGADYPSLIAPASGSC